MTIAQDIIAQLGNVLATQGHPGAFYRKSAPTVAVPVRFLMRHPGLRDEAVVNAYGMNAQIITLAHIPEFITEGPDKFDRIVQDIDAANPLPYVFDAVVRREVGGVVIGWTAYVKGKGS